MILYSLLFTILIIYISKIKRPELHSTNRYIKQLALSYIFPMIIMNSGVLQSMFQHIPTCYILCGTTKTIINLKIKEGVVVLVEKFENNLFEEPVSYTIKFLTAIYNFIYSVFGCFNVKADVNKNVQKIEQKDVNVIIMHGLGGSSSSKHVVGAANMFLKKKCRVFCVNARGVKGTLKNDEFTHFGMTDDIKALTKHILCNYEGRIFYVGFSQGANICTKFMAEYKHERIIGGVSVCNPFNFLKIEEMFLKQRGYIFTYAYRFLGKVFMDYINDSLKTKYKKADIRFILQDLIDNKRLKAESVDAFMNENSSEFYINKIDVPYLFINADDDPVIPTAVIPREKIFKNANTGLVTLQGGHLGFKSIFMTSTVEGIINEFFTNLNKNE